MRALALFLGLSMLGCSDRRPGVTVGFPDLDDKVGMYVYGLGFGGQLEVCGEKASKAQVKVPFDCLLPADLPLHADETIESKPMKLKWKPFLGEAQTFTVTQKLDLVKQMELVEAWLRAAGRGTKLPRNPKKSSGKAGFVLVTPGGGVRPTDAKTVGDVDIVVTVAAVNRHDTGKTCSYTGLMTGRLEAWDADLLAFDAHNGEKLGKKHFDNDSPSCPSSNYGKMGEVNTVSSGPPEREMEAWARTLKPSSKPSDDDE